MPGSKTTAEDVARALAAYADEHGVPNGITPGELASQTG